MNKTIRIENTQPISAVVALDGLDVAVVQTVAANPHYSAAAVAHPVSPEDWQRILNLFGAAPELLAVSRELLEICQWKCGPHDEILIKSRKTNQQVMIEAASLIAKVDGQS